MPRWLAHALVIAGWLLTPLWAWGAAFFGAWIGAHAGLAFSHPVAMLGAVAFGAALCGFATVWGWVRFMRRVPHLLSHHMAPRRSLQQSMPSHD
jgi:hypothetical protein